MRLLLAPAPQPCIYAYVDKSFVKVRNVMLGSKLPMSMLGKIWDLADQDKDGNLDRSVKKKEKYVQHVK